MQEDSRKEEVNSANAEASRVRGESSKASSQRGVSPSSVVQISEPHHSKPKSMAESPGSHGFAKDHSSKKPPPPSHGSTFLGLLPTQFSRLFSSKEENKESKMLSGKYHDAPRRYSEPTGPTQVSEQRAVGKSVSYPEKLPYDKGTGDINVENKKEDKKEEKVHHMHKQEQGQGSEDGTSSKSSASISASPEMTKSGRPARSNSLPPDSDPLFPIKSKPRGLTKSSSIDEFLSNFSRDKGRLSFEGRKSMDADRKERASKAANDTSSRQGHAHLLYLNKQDAKFVVPATGARQLRPHEISRQKYLECLKKKLVPTEFVYTGPAKEVSLIGDWLEWDAVLLIWDEEKACFRVVVDLPVGEHEFRYIVTPKESSRRQSGSEDEKKD
eukprot:jgi/Galph1/5707/GphlegSOOS_G4377.1